MADERGCERASLRFAAIDWEISSPIGFRRLEESGGAVKDDWVWVEIEDVWVREGMERGIVVDSGKVMGGDDMAR